MSTYSASTFGLRIARFSGTCSGPAGPIPGIKEPRPPGGEAGLFEWSSIDRRRWSDRRTDGAQDLADGAAEEQQCHDRDDRDEGQDEGVLGEALSFLVVPMEKIHECEIQLHFVLVTSFP